jgi:toxin ParE1/3/4
VNDPAAGRPVRLAPLAIADLIALRRWVAEVADRATADAWLDRIETRIASLASYPDRGTPRDDLAPGLRTIPFERRLLIAYRVGADVVDVLRVVDARRDLMLLPIG